MRHLWTALSWQGKSLRRITGRCSHVFGLFTGKHQAALLLGRLALDEPQVCAGGRLADGLSVGSIVLLAPDIGFT
jgi:hypothetical protein